MRIHFLEIAINKHFFYLQLLQIRTKNKRFTFFKYDRYKTDYNLILLNVIFCNIVLIDKNYPYKCY